MRTAQLLRLPVAHPPRPPSLPSSPARHLCLRARPPSRDQAAAAAAMAMASPSQMARATAIEPRCHRLPFLLLLAPRPGQSQAPVAPLPPPRRSLPLRRSIQPAPWRALVQLEVRRGKQARSRQSGATASSSSSSASAASPSGATTARRAAARTMLPSMHPRCPLPPAPLQRQPPAPAPAFMRRARCRRPSAPRAS